MPPREHITPHHLADHIIEMMLAGTSSPAGGYCLDCPAWVCERAVKTVEVWNCLRGKPWIILLRPSLEYTLAVKDGKVRAERLQMHYLKWWREPSVTDAEAT